MTDYIKFKELHYTETPLMLGNVWNVQSARVFEQLGFKAIGTSSAAMAHSLGYADGEEMPFKDLLFLVSRIRNCVSLPLTVDIEGGYGNTVEEVFCNIRALSLLGVVGINIEDSYVYNNTRIQKGKDDFTVFLRGVLNRIKEEGIELFVNVRCDSFLLQPSALEDAISRIKSYQLPGVDGMFLPGLTSIEDIKEIKKVLEIPLNIMVLPNLPSLDRLSNVGRVSMGNFQNDYIYTSLSELNTEILNKQSFKMLFAKE
ncbi:MAG: isocitrate lyase/PEP mutase family protein [Flavobacterium sp.]